MGCTAEAVPACRRDRAQFHTAGVFQYAGIHDHAHGARARRKGVKSHFELGDVAATIDAWHRCEDGESSRLPISYLPNTRYIFNGRSLAEYVRTDFSYQAYLLAALIIQSWGRDALNPGLSQRYTKNVSGFVNSGWWEVFGLLGQVSELALQDSWYWKWRVFRRLRPEELAGRIVLAQKAENSTFIDLPMSQTAPKICEAQAVE